MKLTTFDLQLFGGKGGTTVTNIPASVPEMSEEEKALLKKQLEWANTTMPNAKKLEELAMGAIGTQQVNPNPNWQTLYNNTQAQTTKNQNTMNNLQSGVLPTEFMQNRQQVLNTDLNRTIGSAISGLGNRGIINSSVMNKSLDGITKNASNTLASQYSQDLSTQSQLLAQNQQLATDPINNASLAQSASINVPMQYFAMATGQQAPTNDTWKTMSNQRYTMASPAQSIVSQDSGGGLFGGLLGGLGSYLGACFIAGTKIATPFGDKNIEEIKVSDEVLSSDGVVVVTKVSKPKISLDQYILIITNKGEVLTTSTQPFVTSVGNYNADELIIDDMLKYSDGSFAIIKDIVLIDDKEPVYDFTTSDSNTYFANGYLVEGSFE